MAWLRIVLLLLIAGVLPRPASSASSPVVKGYPEPQSIKSSYHADLEVDDADIFQSPVCSEDLLRELVGAVRSLLPLKKQVTIAQNQVQEMYNASMDTKRLVDRIKSDEAATAALREEVARLRREMAQERSRHEAAVNFARTQGRASRGQVQSKCDLETEALQAECVAKIMQLGGEAQQTLALLKEENLLLNTSFSIKEVELAEARVEIAELHLQLETLNSTLQHECHGAEHDAPLTKTRRQPKLSPGKYPKQEESSMIAKMPPSTYKHSCKGFNDPSAPAAPFSTETSIRIGNRQYIVGRDKVTWGEAWRLCKARGMWILSLETEQEQQQLEPHMMHMHNTPTTYWMFARKAEGSGWFSWECAHSEFEPWRHQQPASASQSLRCAHVELHRGEASWGDDACDAKMGYICRKLVTEC